MLKYYSYTSAIFITRLLFCYLIFLFTFEKVCAVQIHHTTRCICRCKAHTYVPWDAIYIESPFTNISSCNCPGVVLPKVKLQEASLYCLGCECKFETRSIRIIQVAVGLIITIISALISYGMFLGCLQPIIKRPPHVEKNMDQIMDDLHHQYPGIGDGYKSFEIYNSFGVHEQASLATPYRSRYAIEETFRQLKNNQDRWKQQLEIQRSKIYN